jgi:hypothetical protein
MQEWRRPALYLFFLAVLQAALSVACSASAAAPHDGAGRRRLQAAVRRLFPSNAQRF